MYRLAGRGGEEESKAGARERESAYGEEYDMAPAICGKGRLEPAYAPGIFLFGLELYSSYFRFYSLCSWLTTGAWFTSLYLFTYSHSVCAELGLAHLTRSFNRAV